MMKQRLLSTFLALVLLCTMLLHTALFVYADENRSGSCGENLSWTFDPETGTLTIEGSGRMDDAAEAQATPWHSFCQSITAISFPDGLTGIGDYSFCGCTGLTELSFPESLNSIGQFAFENCTGLKKLTLPSQISTIETHSFYGCSALAELTLPESLATIENYAFSLCYSIRSIRFPAALKSIGNLAFYGCAGLKEISFSAGLSNIGDFAFFNCSGLTELSFQEGLSSIGSYAFFGCTGLTKLSFPEGLTSIGGHTFYNCIGLTSVVLPKSIESIGSFSLGYQAQGNKNQAISGFMIYGYADTAAQVYATENGFDFIPVEPQALSLCGDQLTWSFNEGTGTLRIEGSGDMWNFSKKAAPWYSSVGKIRQISLPEALTSIGNYAFQECSELTEISFPTGLVSIGKQAFTNCTGLTELVFPAALTSIGDNAFCWCEKLKKVDFPEALNSIGTWSFGYCTALSEFCFPAELSSIGAYAFSGCDNLTEVLLPEKLSFIGEGAFSFCHKLSSFEISAENDSFCTEDGVLFDHGKKLLIDYPCSKTGSYVIPSSVTVIGPWSFCDCAELTGISLPDGLTTIQNGAFTACKGLTELKIPASVVTIEALAFQHCSNFTQLSFPIGLTSIGSGAFEYCTGLNKLVFEESNTAIGEYAFRACVGLRSVIIPKSFTQIGAFAFGYRLDQDNTPISNFTVYGYPESAGQAYANANSFTFIPLDPKSGFSDVDSDAFYYEAMCWAKEKQITNGTSAITFSPKANCTRAQVVTFLWNAQNKPRPTILLNPFLDASAGKFYYLPMLWAYENGITLGTDSTHFSPDASCTRAQVVTYLWRTAGSPEPNASAHNFMDINADRYYYKAVLWACEKGITNGTDSAHFSPNASCTRGQVVTFLYRLLGK